MKNDIDLNDMLAVIIDTKYNEIQKDVNKQNKFHKIYQLEGNAIGQIGETFLKKVMVGMTNIETRIDDTIHDEYDIKTGQGITFEVKTARQGRNSTFQFNGINPSYNVNYIICLGICGDEVVYRIIHKGEKLSYKHEKAIRGWYITNKDFSKKLVSMNPGNDVNLKLTLTKKICFV